MRHTWEEQFCTPQKQWSLLGFVPRGILLRQRAVIKQDIWILQESIRKFDRNNTGFPGSLPWQGTSQLAGSGVGRLPAPRDPPLPCGSSWLLGQPTSQSSSWAAEHPGKQSEGREGKEFGSWQIKRDIRGSSFPWKVLRFWLFIPIQEEIHAWVYVCVSLYIQCNIYACLWVWTSILKCYFLWETKSLFQLAVMNCWCPLFLSRWLEAKIREANSREPSWLKEMSQHCHCTLVQLNMIQEMGLSWEWLL